jgi:hypothetical protein
MSQTGTSIMVPIPTRGGLIAGGILLTRRLAKPGCEAVSQNRGSSIHAAHY